jgi:single-stranded-DNA-specific exonuclease
MIKIREAPDDALYALTRTGLDPFLARIYAARGVQSLQTLNNEIGGLIPPEALKGIDVAIDILERSIAEREPICVVADYDCDGATACAVAVRGLRMFGARIDYLVPNRREHGYGLTPPIVELAARHPRLGRPSLLITVDNGIASHDGVMAAHRAGIKVLITDHHLPGTTLPGAEAIVNPNQPGCPFPSKHLAGVGVMFYVLAALRARYRSKAPDSANAQAPIAELLDLVALGTVADLVRLDDNNRRLVKAGLKRLRSGRACAGVRALMLQGGREPRRATASDLGFTVGPRINAAGRLADISLGIACLLAESEVQAAELAAQLDSINRTRRDIEKTMRDQAFEALSEGIGTSHCVVAADTNWHEGVIGLVAGQLKTRFGRPAFAFAPAANGIQWRGSGRSIAGVHLRDAIDLVAKRSPGLISQFGGHAMAAGITLTGNAVESFTMVMNDVLRETIDPSCLDPGLFSDGELDPSLATPKLIEELEEQVWGQGFPEPVFHHRFKVSSQRVVGERHLRLELVAGAKRYAAIAFNRDQPVPPEATFLYRPGFNEYRGQRTVQLFVEAVVSSSEL